MAVRVGGRLEASMFSTRIRPVTVRTCLGVLVLVSALTGCSGGRGAASGAEGGAATPRPGGSRPTPSASLVKEASAALGTGRTRLEMSRVERFPDRSVLRFFVTNLENHPTAPSYPTSLAGSVFKVINFKLIDPVGHKGYFPLFDVNDNEVSSEPQPSTPGVRYEAVVHFRPIPKDVTAVTVITPTTAGEFSGVPVVDGNGPMTPKAPTRPAAGGSPKSGETLSWPMRRTGKLSSGGVVDLYALTEGKVKSTSSSKVEEKIGLRTDVLFAFDSSRLSADAKAVLDEVAQQTRQNADPAKPPILVTGHTDGRGGHDYNVALSRRRAEAVQRELQTRLGGGYQYKVEGRGETEPVADEGGPDDEKARARNRRVEVSYKIKQQGTRTTAATTTAPAEGVAGGGGRPAAFRSSDGRTVASRTVDVGMFGSTSKRRIDVKPFYRDGAFLVAVFEITNLGPDDLNVMFDYRGDGGGKFGAFSVVDPASGTIYRGVRIGQQNNSDGTPNLAFVDPGWATFNIKPKTTNRGFFYVPAPPPGTKSVIFDAGVFGKFDNIPVE
jgi:OOP family OmpA-OmpF porin